MAKKIRLIDIGKTLGVSAVTVSNALSGQPGVSDEMRVKIKDTAEKMGYQPPRTAREKNTKTYNIGIIISEKYFDQTQSFYWRMYREVATKAAAKGCFTLLEIVNPEDEKNLTTPLLTDGNKVDGLVIVGLMSKEYLDMLESKLSVPYIFLDFYSKEKESDAVITDNFLSMYRLVNHLIEMGHKDIAYVGTLMSTSSITDRYFGYCKALMEHDIPIKEDYIVKDRKLSDGSRFKPEELKLPAKLPTAFACNCDVTAADIISVLKKRKIKVPEEISVVGFDNYLLPGQDIELTTCEVDVKEMAAQTIRILIAKMSGQPYKKGILTVPGRLIYGKTVKKIK